MTTGNLVVSYALIHVIDRILKEIQMRCNLCLMCVTLLAAGRLSAESPMDWPGFLGPGGNPVVVQNDLPTEFVVGKDGAPSKNIAWRVELPGRSVSGPIVVGDRVITTSSSAMEGRWMHVSAVSRDTGELLWHRSTKATGRPYCHPTSANAAPTPCTDGERVFAFFSSNDLVCYDLDGNLQWFRSMTSTHPLAGNDVGMSSSPAVVDGVVVVTVECQADSFTAGLDVETGETKWELPRPPKANWASPRVATGADGEHVIVLHGLDNLIGIEPQTGEQVWEIDLNCSSVATAVFANGKLHVPAGGVKVFEMGAALEAPKQVWETTRISPNSASLLVSSSGLLGLNRSILVCCDETGQRKWNTRLEDAGQVWATPVVAGDHLYAFGMSGKCFVVELKESEAKVVAECELGSEVLGSPAVAGSALFVRSVDALWKIARSD